MAGKDLMKFYPKTTGLSKGREFSLATSLVPISHFILKTGCVFCPPGQGIVLQYPSSSETRILPNFCQIHVPLTYHDPDLEGKREVSLLNDIRSCCWPLPWTAEITRWKCPVVVCLLKVLFLKTLPPVPTVITVPLAPT